jgi:hypothetical protein
MASAQDIAMPADVTDEAPLDRPRKAGIFLAVVAVAAAPMPGALLRWGGLPPQFGVFPPTVVGAPKPAFSWVVFLLAVAIALPMTAFLVAPQRFGFRGAPSAAGPRRSARLPWWFYAGAVINLASWALMWFGSLPLAAFAFIPQWWGFIVLIDGLTYARTATSLLSRAPKRLLAIGLESMVGWGLFEFINYYGAELWVYPINSIFPESFRRVWFLVSFSTVLPTVYVWSALLASFDGLARRYRGGSALVMRRKHHWICLAVGLGIMVLFGFFPFAIYPFLWVGPGLVFGSALELCGFWTPLRNLARGDASHLAVAALAALVNGFFWEMWNYGSKFFHPGAPTNPNYWFYDLPYVNRFHFFSEMPLLGYYGYLPYGIVAWFTWLISAGLFGVRVETDTGTAPRW